MISRHLLASVQRAGLRQGLLVHSLRPLSLFTWGNCDHGRLGHEDLLLPPPDSPNFTFERKNLTFPRKVFPPRILGEMGKFVEFACGGGHLVAVTRGGRVLTCGLNDDGQLGVGDLQEKHSLEIVPALENVVQVAAGYAHTVARTADGKLYTFGRGKQGILGLDKRPNVVNLPTLVSRLANDGIKIVDIASGAYHTLAVAEDGSVYCFGVNFSGCLGPDAGKFEPLPVKMKSLSAAKVKRVFAGFYSSAAYTEDRVVLTWGQGVYGQLGQGEPKDSKNPLVLKSLVGLDVTGLSFGQTHACLTDSSGHLYVWGDGSLGQLGLKKLMDRRYEPYIVPEVSEAGAVSAAAGVSCTVAVTRKGDLWGFGLGEHGQMGLGDDFNYTTAKKGMTGQNLKKVKLGWSWGAAL